MKNRLSKYILALSILLTALLSQFSAYSGAPEPAAGNDALSAFEILSYNAAHVKVKPVTVVSESRDRITNDTDTEEENFQSQGKKPIKQAFAPTSAYFSGLLPGTAADSYGKSRDFTDHFTSFSPFRRYITLCVIRI